MPATYVFGTVVSFPKQTVGTSRQTLLGGSDRSAREVWITADDANTGKLFLGDVTVTSAGGGNVFSKLSAGVGIVLQMNHTNLLNIVGSASGQVYYVGVLD